MAVVNSGLQSIGCSMGMTAIILKYLMVEKER